MDKGDNYGLGEKLKNRIVLQHMAKASCENERIVWGVGASGVGWR